MDGCNPETKGIPEGTIHSTILLLQNALTKLDAHVEDSVVERIGIMIQQAMSMQNRSFHTPEHIFDLIDDNEPHYSLAAAFHDIVYYQVDRGFHSLIEQILTPYIEIEGDAVRIRTGIDPDDRAFHGTASIFGFTEGQTLSPFGGLNEFLSALVMNRLLVEFVSDTDLLIATSAIEMTIPFRPPNGQGQTAAELLAQRIRRTSEVFRLCMDEADISAAVVSAVTLANRDIGNFAEDDSARFLDNTWKLLPETNPQLFFRGLYTIRSYAEALRKMEGFLSGLRAENVFQHYAGYPDPADYSSLVQRTGKNLTVARRYLGIKMISTGILLALAELSGGDAPIAFFMGDANPSKDWCRLTHHLPDAAEDKYPSSPERVELFRLFREGRTNESEFDLQNSPLTHFIYCNLDDDQTMKYIGISKDYLNSRIDAGSFLEVLPAYIVSNIARAASILAFTRRQRLDEIASSFPDTGPGI